MVSVGFHREWYSAPGEEGKEGKTHLKFDDRGERDYEKEERQ